MPNKFAIPRWSVPPSLPVLVGVRRTACVPVHEPELVRHFSFTSHFNTTLCHRHTETGTISALTYNPMCASIPQHLHAPSPGMYLERKNAQLPVSAPSRLLSLLSPRHMNSHPSSLFLFHSPPAPYLPEPYPPTAAWPYTGPTLTHAVPTRTSPCTPSLRN